MSPEYKGQRKLIKESENKITLLLYWKKKKTVVTRLIPQASETQYLNAFYIGQNLYIEENIEKLLYLTALSCGKDILLL